MAGEQQNGSAPQAQNPITIRQATSPADMAETIKCFNAYTQWLAVDFTFQNYAAELQGLPGKYAPPTGALLLACDAATDEVLGCIALRPLELSPEYKRLHEGDVRYCELKRLFVWPAARGRQVARKLISRAVEIARKEGYDEILLDTLSKMTPAIKLYESEGFSRTEPYYMNPLEGVCFYKRRLHLENGSS